MIMHLLVFSSNGNEWLRYCCSERGTRNPTNTPNTRGSTKYTILLGRQRFLFLREDESLKA